MSGYGLCPRCGAPGVTRERRPNGNDRCSQGHTYPSAKAMKSFNTSEGVEGGVVPTEFGLTKPGGFYPGYINLKSAGEGTGFALTVREDPSSDPHPSHALRREGRVVRLALTRRDIALLREHLNSIEI